MTDELRLACARALHTVSPDGEIRGGGRAVIVVIERLGHPHLARFLSWPPMVWVAALSYRLVASHRGFFAHFLFRK